MIGTYGDDHAILAFIHEHFPPNNLDINVLVTGFFSFPIKTFRQNLFIRSANLSLFLSESCEQSTGAEFYVNLSFVQLSRLAVTLRVKSPRSGANRHALFIRWGGCPMGKTARAHAGNRNARSI